LGGGSSTAPEEPSSASSLGVVVCDPSQSYWASNEAKKLFKLLDDEQDAIDAITNQMELLSYVLSDATDYLSVVIGLEKDHDTVHQKWTIQICCQYLYCSLYYAK
jgi:hypothetical protein